MKKTTLPPAFGGISEEQIEAINLRRIIYICICAICIQIINLTNPAFWQSPQLWGGSIFLTVFSVGFLILVILVQKKERPVGNPRALHAVFWSLMTVGFFPFLVRDASLGDMPMNCVLLSTVLICTPLLRVRELRIVFTVDAAVNLAAAFYAGSSSLHYCLEVCTITGIAFLMADNLHGRYFALLSEQRRQYNEYMAAAAQKQALQVHLEKERAANAAKNEFLARMSHDLRTPLNGVIGMANLAQDASLGEETRERYLREIVQSGNYLLSLINDVLDMSRIESDKLTLHPEPYGREEFLATVRSVMEGPCQEKDLRFRITVPEEEMPRFLWLDKLRFNQIFLNLLSNAAKFTPQGGTVELVIEQTARRGQTVDMRITVRDTGVGMSAEFLPHAFDSFTQEQENDGTVGTGLGLSIVKKLVELMGGTIDMESRPGCGTSAVVTLSAEEAPCQLKKAADPETGLEGKRVLLCEDNEINAEITAALLMRRGALVDRAENGRAGADRFAASPVNGYDAILMDIRMPVLGGLDAAREIRSMARPDALKVPILALTANTLDADKTACRQAGMNGHLAKPIDPTKMYEALIKAMEDDVPADC